MSVQTPILENLWSQIKHMWVISTHLKLCFAIERHSFKWLKISDNVAGEMVNTFKDMRQNNIFAKKWNVWKFLMDAWRQQAAQSAAISCV